jgi:PPK2 family polyphosphate:nucleotide phosphotransferase
VDQYRVVPGSVVDLIKVDPGDRGGLSKPEGEKQLVPLRRRLEELQELLYADRRHRLLVVLQAIDTGGKDGAIRRVFEGVDPLGVTVASFRVPTEDELAHDYLWRVHRHTPGDGEITIFNRSHYEDVLVVRVKGLVPPERLKKRFDHINDFERLLTDEGTTVIKFFLYISKDEQRRRLQARIDNPTKQWKFAMADLDERKLWDEYMAAYEEVLSRTSTKWAPWYIVPANRKWYRDLVISRVLVDTLESLKLRYPEPSTPLDGVIVE